MPTYEYICAKCGQEFDKVQSIKENALTVCPRDVCPKKRWGKGKVKRRIGTGGGLIFKGSGFYSTDYRSENYKAGAKKETAAASPPAAESKPAAATSGTPAAKPAATPPTPSPKSKD